MLDSQLPESTEDAEKRVLELEGKNITHYSIMLESWIAGYCGDRACLYVPRTFAALLR
jgi:hypothetical protein